MSAPCGGCPPHCTDCVFSASDGSSPGHTTKVIVIMPKEKYGCIRPNGGDVVTVDGKLGMMRGERFHAVTPRGASFLRETKNPLAVHC